MNHNEATAAVARITEYTIGFLARKNCVTRDEIVAGLVKGDTRLMKQWNTCFAWAAQQAVA